MHSGNNESTTWGTWQMKTKQSNLARTCCAAAVSLAMTQFAQAQAQLQEAAAPVAVVAAVSAPDAGATERVVVTGSRIARRDADTSAPMLTLTRDDIKFAAPTSIGDMLQALPNTGVSLNSNGTQGTSYGVSSINLR